MSSNVLDFWGASQPAGRQLEQSVTSVLRQELGLLLQDNAADEHKNPDLKGEMYLDTKLILTPYPTEPTPSRLSRAEHLTLDMSCIEHYPEGTCILMVVDYTRSGVPTKGIFYITARRVAEIAAKDPHRIYNRSFRSNKDKSKKVGVSTHECGLLTLPGLDASESVDKIRGLSAEHAVA